MAEVKGILGRKIGMTQVFDENGRAVPVTVVEAGPCRVAQVKTPETDGYAAIQLAFGEPKRTSKPAAGHFAKAGVDPARHLVELRLDELGDMAPGLEIRADVFEPGEVVDVIGVTKGKGFAGGMKRHNFKGQRMAGHLGHVRVTTLNLTVIKADAERNLILIRGAVPGPKNGIVMIRSAIRLRRRGGTTRKAS